MDEHLHIVPLLLEVLAVVLEEFCQFVSHFLGDVAADFLHIVVALQVTAADIQRDVGRVNHAVEQRQVLRHDVLYLVGNEHLVAIELNLVAVHIEIVLDFREVEDTRQVEGVVHIQVDMEEGLVHLHGVEFVVELVVVLVGEVGGLARPCGRDIVYDVILVGLDLLAVFPLFLLSEGNLHGQELAVFLQQPFDGGVL